MPPRTGILVVAYNAAATLRSTLERVRPATLSRIEEILVFDDCSEDDTWNVARQTAESFAGCLLTIHRNHANMKYGGNQKRGFAYARSRGLDQVVLLHGDGQYAPEVMDRLLEPLDAGRAELVMGSRMMVPGAARLGRMPLYKYVGNRVLSAAQNWMLGTKFTEFHSGYRAYLMSALNAINLEGLTDSWHFDTQIILEFLRRGHRVVEVPIPTYYGNEICHVSGIPYAFQCLKTTLLFALARFWMQVLVPRAQRSKQQSPPGCSVGSQSRTGTGS